MFSGYIGQEDRLRALKAAIIASRTSNNPLPHMLLLGQTGAGKTRLAKAIGEEMEKPVVILHAPNVVERHDLTSKIIEAEGGVLFIDEIHALSRNLAEDLYTVIDSHTLVVEESIYARDVGTEYFASVDDLPQEFYQTWEGAGYYSYPILRDTGKKRVETISTNVTIIGATTDEALLPDAFLSRLSALKVYLRDYTLVELSTIGILYAEELGIDLSNEAAVYLAERSLSNPRRMKHLVERSSDVAVSGNEPDIALTAAQVAVDSLGVDSLGLEPPHRAILLALHRAGSAGLSRTSLGQTLGFAPKNLDHYWSDLMKQGLVSIDTRHRITSNGIKAISSE